MRGASETVRYWHGGRRGIRRGAYILPPSITNVLSTSDFGGKGIHRTDRVYVTTQIGAALLYASAIRRGVIYECEPIGDIEIDPDCTMSGLAYQCEKARVIRCIKPKESDIAMARDILLNE